MNKILFDSKKTMMYIVVIFILTLFFCPVAFADQSAGFSVRPILSENQVNSEVGYFDLNLEPGESQTLSLELRNMSDEEINLSISVHTAFTNVSGVVEYGSDADVPNDTLPFFLADYIEGDGKITLSEGETKQVDLLLTLPEDKPFEGVLAAGIRVEEIKDGEHLSEESMAIENTLSYVMGLVVSNKREQLSPELDLLAVYADQLNFRNVFSAQIQNQSGAFVNQLEVIASIYNEDQTERLYSTEASGMQMAPHSNFAFPIPLNGESFVSGTYVLHLQANSGELEWEWTRSFVVDDQTSKTFNRQDITIPSQTNYWLLVSIFLVILLILVILIRKRK
ncbi:DUF916 and DUF3324 domain-containing protein [Enterococcus casseliflavus]|uniref:DUF916 and DUF3324 domain-containing protein n=1 Tax=Enterococcus casseliflavus TaxID=37734 RepID=UPI00232D8827|nr:DUF916 and DUF3324 domain-containing protein [Enterococcus casseliflavus]MDB1696191.1 DUF916 and DUF3324 domain-containing protein [Enterococcus casseliflavus]MDB1699713.1 DUF916 and DUF3324 domain-containing protein [Enterococcus casseliflavus]MDB1702263.1 DUF916 and DUF3324 domain-containing protein [Enterococcus casseliflavus]MDB1704555.1 DUF916 and DUF3324 domain-containing protein [Enterococcus casseliflavus]